MTTSEDNFKFLGLEKGQFLVALIVAFALGAVLNAATLAYAVSQNSERVAAEAALFYNQLRIDCAQKTYAQAQVVATSDLLADNSGSIVGGVPRHILSAQLDSLRQYRDTFKSLDCREFSGSAPS